MIQEQLLNVFHTQLHLLQTTLKLDVLKGDFKARFGTMSVESALSDLCQCVINNTEKREKRINRISMIVDIYQQFGYEFTPDLLETIEIVKLLQFQDEQEQSSIEKLAKLREELSNEAEMQNGKIYFETGKWTSPIVKNFHGMCTKAINKDGDVYDLMMKIAIITFARLLSNKQEYEINNCATELLSGAQLIFKGGAAIGKFLFEKNTFWNLLTKNQQDKIRSSFILGGDNDTSIYFINMKEVTMKYGQTVVSKSIVEIASRMQQTLWETCQEFEIDRLLSVHSDNTVRDQILFAGHRFDLTTRKATGFQLKEVDFDEINEYELINHEELNEEFELVEKPTILCLSPYDNYIPSQVFTTQSKVEFSVRDKSVKFELVRAKFGFRAICDDMIVNTYSELLDISLEYPESTSLFYKKFIGITL